MPTPIRPRLHVLDGSGYIFRAYYAIRHLSSPQGVPTNALFGFGRMLLKFLQQEQPTHLAIALDTAAPTFRHEMYAAYKANRQAPPEDLIPQFALIRQLIEAMAIPMLRMEGFEADDLLATLSHQALQAGYDVVIVSADKDLMQLVGPHVTMIDPMKDIYLDSRGVVEQFGVEPHWVVDVLALAGDSSDNVPGVPRIGMKTAVQLVQRFGDLAAIYQGLQQQPKRKANENALLAHYDQAVLSKQLVTLRKDVPIQLDWSTLARQPMQHHRLRELLQPLGIQTLLQDLQQLALPVEPKLTQPSVDGHVGGQAQAQLEPAESAMPSPSQPTEHEAAPLQQQYLLIQELSQLEQMVQAAYRSKLVAIDTETTHLEAHLAQLVGIALAVPGQQACYIPIGHLTQEPQLSPPQVQAILGPLLADPSIGKCGQNLKYDITVLQQAGMPLQGIVDDSMLAAYLLNPGQHSYGLDHLSRQFLGHTTQTFQQVMATSGNPQSFAHVSLPQATAYAAEDAAVSLALCRHFQPALQSTEAMDVYRNIELPLLPILAQMERTGILVDEAELQLLKVEFQTRLRELADEAYALIGEPINLASSKQLGKLFFETMGLPVIKRTKTGYSTDHEVLEILSQTQPVAKIILAHRTLAKLLSTYVDGLGHALDEHHRIHTHFQQTGTATGRLSSTQPNMQNIPNRGDDGRRIRKIFISQPGWLLLAADYSQIELRILAHVSQDQDFIDCYKRGEDIHARTAQEILSQGQPPTSAQRNRAKTINFGILYGQTEFGLAKQLGIPRHEAKSFMTRYFARFPKLHAYFQQTIEQARKRGYVQTLAGRRRYLPELHSQNKNLRQGAERMAMNTPIQGSAADLIKLAMIRVAGQLHKQQLQARLLLQVHDELVLEVPQHEVEICQELVRKAMTEVMPLRVPLAIQMGLGHNWADAH